MSLCTLKNGAGWLRRIGLFCLALAVSASAGNASDRPLPGLDSLKSLAASLLKRKSPPSGAYCEAYDITQVYACSGGKRASARVLVRPDGSVSRFRYRAWNESGDPALGEFRGSLSPGHWTELLRAIAAMRWTDEPGMPNPAPPPGPTQSIAVLNLSDGNMTASFSISLPAPSSLTDAMDMPGILADSATDTVWAVRLENPRIKIGKGGIAFTAEWKAWGKGPVSIYWPDASDSNGCGQASLQWSAAQGDESISRSEKANRDKRTKSSWKVEAGKTSRMEIHFPYSEPINTKKVGKLMEFGVLATSSGAAEPVPLTFFSDRTGF